MQENYYQDSTLLSEEILRAVEQMNYKTMTPIQSEAIPIILEGHDLIGQSATGSGKTAAFGIPAIEMQQQEPTNRPKVLIISPTRELAMQISDELTKFSKCKKNISLATVYGGQSMENQIHQLKKAHIVVGTPGRMMDHMRRRTLKMEEINMIILDEADEMLNMGFLDDIRYILSEAPSERQTILFSATMPKEIRRIADEFLNNPKHIKIESEQQTAENINQYFTYVSQRDKKEALKILLLYYRPTRSLIFCNTKKMVDDLVDFLSNSGYSAIGLHGDMRQATRTKVMNDYKDGKVGILIATDVAARGIDVNDIDAVFNFDLPQELEYYVHRIGRTARAGKTGSSYTLISNQMQLRSIKEIQRRTNADISEIDLPSSEEILEQYKRDLVANIKEKSDIKTPRYNHFSELIDNCQDENTTYRDIAITLLQMLAKHDSAIDPNIKEVATLGNRRQKNEQKHTKTTFGKTASIKLSVGNDHSVKPKHIVGAIVQETGMSSNSIGKIKIQAKQTFVEMHPDDAISLLNMTDTLRINRINVSVQKHEEHVHSHKSKKTNKPNQNKKYSKQNKSGNNRKKNQTQYRRRND